MSVAKMTGNWSGVGGMLATAGSPLLWKKAKHRAVLREAHRIRKLMIMAFQTGGPAGHKWKALSAFTQLVSRAQGHGDRRPLMRTGDLRNSHSVVEVDDDTVFVGVHKSAKGKKSKKEMVNIAAIHEYGTKPYTIDVTWGGGPKTERVRAFFFWLFMKTKGQIKMLKRSTKVIIVRIPARPWMNPIWEAEKEKSGANITTDTIRGLGIPGLSDLL